MFLKNIKIKKDAMGSPQHFVAQATLQDDTHTPAVSGHVSLLIPPGPALERWLRTTH